MVDESVVTVTRRGRLYREYRRHNLIHIYFQKYILKINKKLQKTIKSLSKKKGLKAPFECV